MNDKELLQRLAKLLIDSDVSAELVKQMLTSETVDTAMFIEFMQCLAGLRDHLPTVSTQDAPAEDQPVLEEGVFKVGDRVRKGNTYGVLEEFHKHHTNTAWVRWDGYKGLNWYSLRDLVFVSRVESAQP